jgi:hypothetical protein
VIPTDPEIPVEDPNQRWEVEILVTREDGSVAQGAAVIATHSSGRQEYAPTDENGIATLYLLKGKYFIEVCRDGQHGTIDVEVASEPIQKKLQLKDHRTLYVLVDASGSYDGEPDELANYSILPDAIRAKYPKAVYITSQNLHDVEFRDGDALLSVELFVENYTSNEQYFASEICINFRAYQESITVWDIDEYGEEIEVEYVDENMCSIQVRNEYDYEYKNSVSVITESYYVVQKDWHLSKYSNWANDWGYGYTTERILSTSNEQQTKAPGAGMKTEAFWAEINSNRLNDYLTYLEQIFPYVDLWMSGKWNAGIEQLTTA